MSDATQELGRIKWSECFRFTQLFRAFRMAIHPTKLMLAFCGVFLTYGSGRVLDAAWPTSSRPAVSVVDETTTSELAVFLQTPGGGRQATSDWLEALESPQRTGAFALLLGHTRATIKRVTSAVVSADVGGLVGGVRSGVRGVVWLFALHPVYAVLFSVVGLIIWAYFGGAICRVAALHATREERIGFREALAFANQKFLSFLAAPLMPVAILLMFAVFLYLGGLMGAIPAVGEILAGILFFLALTGGFIMAFVTIGAVAGYALTFPTIAVEGSDAFDALSRSFSYIYQRPWRSAFYGLLSLAYGAICLVFVKFLARIMLCAVHLFVGLSMNLGSPYVADSAAGASADVPKLDAMWQGPSLTGETAFWGRFEDQQLAHVSAFGRFWFCLWIFSVVGLVGAFVVSFYYSSSTLIYLLLRREVDATDLEEVQLDEPPLDEQPATSDPPPASEQIEREPEDTSPPVTEQPPP